ncbi:hypothetical protein BC936DRAFT_141698 [Jimgerdemannia flammicorona]|uniref:Uncharacterized protein n=1 Tax=Jimgerdemannia flammicorona TaxID=994334 RepID=A0A433A1S7_9FUNG|nr:hypothetical protein BC936DRAFT_141698 [Jimgerdemannia flammicorona]
MSDKRKDPPSAVSTVVKRQRQEDDQPAASTALTTINAPGSSAVSIVGTVRHSSLSTPYWPVEVDQFMTK